MSSVTEGAEIKSRVPIMIVLITHIGIVIPLLILYTLIYLNEGPIRLIFPGSVLSLCTFVWFGISWRIIAGTLFHPYFIFLLTAILFNGGQIILEVFGLNNNGILSGTFSDFTILNSILLVSFGLSFFHLGALLSYLPEKGKKVDKKQENFSYKEIQFVGWILLGVSFVPAVLMIQEKLQVIMSSGYLGLFGREEATGFGNATNLLASFLVPASYFLLAGSNKKRFPIIIATIIIVVYATIIFFTGIRSSAGMSLAGFAFVYDRTVRRVPRIPLLISGCLLILVVFPIIAATREIAGADKSTATLLGTMNVVENPAVQSLSEMGTSMNTISYTLDLVPSIRNYDYGLSYYYGLLTVIPNLYWDLHPSIKRGALAHWLVWQVDPDWAERGGGYGYSFIAEAYINFGWFGILFLGLLGFLFAKLSKWSDHKIHPARIAMLASYLSFFLLYARGEFTAIFRPLIWYALIPYLMTFGVKILLNKNSGGKKNYENVIRS